jgi:hypothetical protein
MMDTLVEFGNVEIGDVFRYADRTWCKVSRTTARPWLLVPNLHKLPVGVFSLTEEVLIDTEL